MKDGTKLTLAAACIAVVATSADAARWGRPGLWTMSTVMSMQMGGMPAAMTPAQMARMKKMGVKMPMAGQPVETKMCVTPQDAEAFGSHHYSSADAGCHQTSITRTGNHIHTIVSCNGRMQGQGTADVTLTDDAHYKTTFTFNGTSHGRPVNMKIDTSAHWLSGDCGNIKPFHPQAG